MLQHNTLMPSLGNPLAIFIYNLVTLVTYIFGRVEAAGGLHH